MRDRFGGLRREPIEVSCRAHEVRRCVVARLLAPDSDLPNDRNEPPYDLAAAASLTASGSRSITLSRFWAPRPPRGLTCIYALCNNSFVLSHRVIIEAAGSGADFHWAFAAAAPPGASAPSQRSSTVGIEVRRSMSSWDRRRRPPSRCRPGPPAPPAVAPAQNPAVRRVGPGSSRLGDTPPGGKIERPSPPREAPASAPPAPRGLPRSAPRAPRRLLASAATTPPALPGISPIVISAYPTSTSGFGAWRRQPASATSTSRPSEARSSATGSTPVSFAW
jgi:hypothetical protein